MPEEKQIPEFYSDVFEIVGGPYGVTINFRKSPPEPRAGGPETVVRVRMSWEHVKSMAYIIWRYVRRVEQESGVFYPVPIKVLSDQGIGLEDWEKFWKSTPPF